MLRNDILFHKYTIAERGKIVASVRYIMTVEPGSSEYPCMAYAFLAPNLRPLAHVVTAITLDDFQRNGRCERFNREICYDMGTHKIPCSAFAEDASPSVAWNSKIQYFYRGYAAGEAMEKGNLSFQDLGGFNVDTLAKYFKTLPIFTLRGLGFSDYPLLIIVMALCMLVTLRTPLWPFSLLAIFSHLFHVMATHNIPRYHGVEIPIMVICTFYCFKRLSSYITGPDADAFNRIKTVIKRRFWRYRRLSPLSQ